MAGMLHDMGKAMMPLEVLNKPGKPTGRRVPDHEDHPQRGCRAAAGGQGRGEVALTSAAPPREAPTAAATRTACGDALTRVARMGACATSTTPSPPTAPTRPAGTRPNRSPRWPLLAGQFDTEIFQAFVKSLGIYPIGSLAHALGSWAWWSSRTRARWWRPGRSFVLLDALEHAGAHRAGRPLRAGLRRRHRRASSNAQWKFPHLDEPGWAREGASFGKT